MGTLYFFSLPRTGWDQRPNHDHGPIQASSLLLWPVYGARLRTVEKQGALKHIYTDMRARHEHIRITTTKQ